MQWIDSHLHLADEKMGDVDSLVGRALEAGVSKQVVICTSREDVQRALPIRKKYPEHVFLVGSTTPHEAEGLGEKDFPFFRDLATDGTFIGVGETGLDYYYEHSNRELQQKWLREYLRLARKLDLPIVIHCREAFSDFFSILDEEGGYRRGVLHCFTGTLAEAMEVVKRGWYVSFSGIVTFKKSLDLQDAAKAVPLENILIETDAPYLAPQSKRGKQNEPSFLPEVGECIARLKGITPEEVASATWKNTHNLFRGLQNS